MLALRAVARFPLSITTGSARAEIGGNGAERDPQTIEIIDAGDVHGEILEEQVELLPLDEPLGELKLLHPSGPLWP